MLYLADRNILVDQPKDEYFDQGFEAVHKLGRGVVQMGRHIYFAPYQSMEQGKEDETFDIIDFVYATRKFNDPDFDGPPIRRYEYTPDEEGNLVESVEEDSTAGETGEGEQYDELGPVEQETQWKLRGRRLVEVLPVAEDAFGQVVDDVPRASGGTVGLPVECAADRRQPLLAVEEVLDVMADRQRVDLQTRDRPLTGEFQGALPEQDAADRVVPRHRAEQVQDLLA